MNYIQRPSFSMPKHNSNMKFQLKSIIAGFALVLVILVIYISTIPNHQSQEDGKLRWLQEWLEKERQKKAGVQNPNELQSENDETNFLYDDAFWGVTTTEGPTDNSEYTDTEWETTTESNGNKIFSNNYQGQFGLPVLQRPLESASVTKGIPNTSTGMDLKNKAIEESKKPPMLSEQTNNVPQNANGGNRVVNIVDDIKKEQTNLANSAQNEKQNFLKAALLKTLFGDSSANNNNEKQPQVNANVPNQDEASKTAQNEQDNFLKTLLLKTLFGDSNDNNGKQPQVNVNVPNQYNTRKTASNDGNSVPSVQENSNRDNNYARPQTGDIALKPGVVNPVPSLQGDNYRESNNNVQLRPDVQQTGEAPAKPFHEKVKEILAKQLKLDASMRGETEPDNVISVPSVQKENYGETNKYGQLTPDRLQTGDTAVKPGVGNPVPLPQGANYRESNDNVQLRPDIQQNVETRVKPFHEKVKEILAKQLNMNAQGREETESTYANQEPDEAVKPFHEKVKSTDVNQEPDAAIKPFHEKVKDILAQQKVPNAPMREETAPADLAGTEQNDELSGDKKPSIDNVITKSDAQVPEVNGAVSEDTKKQEAANNADAVMQSIINRVPSETSNLALYKPEAGRKLTDQELENILQNIQNPKKYMYLKVYRWDTPLPDDEMPPTCKALQTLTDFVRVCIHPLQDDSGVSSSLTVKASWESAMNRDVQMALSRNRSSGLIDVGAGIGVYSLAAASQNHPVVAVEPYMPHVRLMHRSVLLNKFQDNITLVCNPVSDTHEELRAEPIPGHMTQVKWNYVPRMLGYNRDENDENTAYTVKLDDVLYVVNFTTAVLKLDVPGYELKALRSARLLFHNINITHVFMHWDTKHPRDYEGIINFLTLRHYRPRDGLNGKELERLGLTGREVQNMVWEKTPPPVVKEVPSHIVKIKKTKIIN